MHNIGKSEYKGIEIDNVPIINLFDEFDRYYKLVVKTDFLEKAKAPPIETPCETWFGMPGQLVSSILRRCFIGFESYLRYCVFELSGRRGILQADAEFYRFYQNPWLEGGGTVKVLYHKLPSKVQENLSLLMCNPHLYQETLDLYSHLRNPLFHGCNVTSVNESARGVRNVMEHIRSLYYWIEHWPVDEWKPSIGNGGPLIFKTGL